ncbi:MAG: VWA domain-containing protein [Planctomycetota bacterium]|nr:VWA domain-containing protein [Planctomycetota bacterium]
MLSWLPELRYPELLLLAIPIGFAYRQWGATTGVTNWLRLVIVGLLLFALSGPSINIGGRGLDIIVIADRSRSMPDGADARIQELIANLENNRGTGDRLAVVGFGSDSALEYSLSTQTTLDQFKHPVSADGSDLNDAILTGLNYVDPDRPARVLVLSDGEYNGASPLSAARRAREQRVPIDFRHFERLRVGDAAVDSLQLPETVGPGEQFQFEVVISADQDTPAKVRLFRDGEDLATQDTQLLAGQNQLLFRDQPEKPGFYKYTVKLDVLGDPLEENNVGAGVLRVDAGPKLLVLNHDGAEDNLVRAMKAGRIPVDVAVAAEHPMTQDALDPYRAVILENVPAGTLGRVKMERLRQFVEDLGGGLMLTGGERSFGSGGYFKSPLDDVLPVSMEMREEHRKMRVAIAIALDRSGSMRQPVDGGLTKMDLANLGTAECVKLLSPGDSVAVLVVDTEAHEIQGLTRITNKDAIVRKVRDIKSEGGGIYVYNALVAAGQQLAKADQTTKHIILFSDAGDSEQPGEYQALLKKFAENHITVSVIGLGSEDDQHAALLKDIAKLGGGNAMFTRDAKELPRLFTEDTMSVARSSFVTADEKTQPGGIAGRLRRSEARLLADFDEGPFPRVGGYNLTYPRPQASVGVLSDDEYDAPWSAFWYRGLGRVAAMTLEVDGEYTGQFGRWNGYAEFLVAHARWLVGGEAPQRAYVDVKRDGQDAVVTIEMNPDLMDRGETSPPKLIIVPPGAEPESRQEPEMVWVDTHTLQGRFTLDRTGTYRTLVRNADGQITRGPALTLPYSPEFAPRHELPSGRKTLDELAEITGGTVRSGILEILREPPRAPRHVALLSWLAVLAILLLLTEIAGRRLALWSRIARPATESGTVSNAENRSWIPQWRFTRRRKRDVAISVPDSPTIGPDVLPATPATSHVYDRAKKQARRRRNE